jgi:excinuclease ABC subunit A
MKILNLDYLSLDRPLNTLSGGEKQRLYLLSRLLKDVEDTFIVFENLSFGLSPREILRLGQFLQSLVQKNNTIVIIDADPLFASLAHSEISF